MAAERTRGAAANAAAVPLADGRAQSRTAKSAPAGDRIKCHIKMPKPVENAVLFGTFMVYLRHGKQGCFGDK